MSNQIILYDLCVCVFMTTSMPELVLDNQDWQYLGFTIMQIFKFTSLMKITI